MSRLTSQEAMHIMRLRIVIARAGQVDSMRWWEDSSLTPEGLYTLERVFPGSPLLMGRNLTLASAATRHEVALRELDNTLHLFRISQENVDRLAMRDLTDDLDESAAVPIPDIETLRHRLLDIIGTPPHYEVSKVRSQHGGVRLDVSSLPDSVQRANALAWTYIQGSIENPVFPYFGERHNDN